MPSDTPTVLEYAPSKGRFRFITRRRVLIFLAIALVAIGFHVFRPWILRTTWSFLEYERGKYTAMDDLASGRLTPEELASLARDHVQHVDKYNIANTGADARGYRSAFQSRIDDPYPDHVYDLASAYASSKKSAEADWSAHQLSTLESGLPNFRNMVEGGLRSEIIHTGYLGCPECCTAAYQKFLHDKTNGKSLGETLDFIHIGISPPDLIGDKRGVQPENPAFDISPAWYGDLGYSLDAGVRLGWTINKAGLVDMWGETSRLPRRWLATGLAKQPVIFRVDREDQTVMWQYEISPAATPLIIGWHWGTGLRLAAGFVGGGRTQPSPTPFLDWVQSKLPFN